MSKHAIYVREQRSNHSGMDISCKSTSWLFLREKNVGRYETYAKRCLWLQIAVSCDMWDHKFRDNYTNQIGNNTHCSRIIDSPIYMHFWPSDTPYGGHKFNIFNKSYEVQSES